MILTFQKNLIPVNCVVNPWPLAYMCHHSSFLVYESMENPTQNRWNKITHISVGASCLIILLFGTFGYVTFTGYSQGDLLENYCMSDDLANTARILFSITIMLTYPIECFVVREVYLKTSLNWTELQLVFVWQVLENAIWDGKPPDTPKHHLMITTAIVATTFIFSTFTDCLGIVLELNVSLNLFFVENPNKLWIKSLTQTLIHRKN